MSPGPKPADEAVPDPSMEDILASIRRILNDGEPADIVEEEIEVALETEVVAEAPTETAEPEDVFILDPDMMISEATETVIEAAAETAAEPEATPGEVLLATESAAAASSAVGSLLKALNERHTQVSRGGPTLEDLVRDEIRPIAREWLNTHLPPIVERLVRAEIERVVARAVG